MNFQSFTEETENHEENLIKMVQAGPSSRLSFKMYDNNCNQTSPVQVQVKKTYHPNEYKTNSEPESEQLELQKLRLEKDQMETKLKLENQELKLQLDEMQDKVAKSQHDLEAMDLQLKRTIGNVHEEKINVQDNLQANYSAFQNEIQTLRKDLKQKEVFLQELVLDKDKLHDKLDEKTELIEALKSKNLQLEASRVGIEQETSSQIRRVSDCLREIKQLQDQCSTYQAKLETLQTRLLSEQAVSRDLRSENQSLNEELTSIKTDSNDKAAKIEDLRGHIQNYVTEVKVKLILNS